ncbi:hypothetical protein J6590_029617 [Homalodisca vitripennis]|nr:hypothetical protein J6590_029617 [Homalodisca vitripennis]
MYKSSGKVSTLEPLIAPAHHSSRKTPPKVNAGGEPTVKLISLDLEVMLIKLNSFGPNYCMMEWSLLTPLAAIFSTPIVNAFSSSATGLLNLFPSGLEVV